MNTQPATALPPLTDPQQHTLQVLLADLLPAVADKGFPAGDAQALVRHLGTAPAATQCKQTFLDPLEAECAALPYADMPSAERLRLLAEVKRRHLPVFSGFFTAAVQAYCLDPRVILALGEQPRAPFPDGYPVADGALDLLEAVYERGPCYRPC